MVLAHSYIYQQKEIILGGLHILQRVHSGMHLFLLIKSFLQVIFLFFFGWGLSIFFIFARNGKW